MLATQEKKRRIKSAAKKKQMLGFALDLRAFEKARAKLLSFLGTLFCCYLV